MKTVDMQKRALVTGGTGFIGSRLAKRLVDDGWNLHLVVRNSSDMLLISDFRQNVTLHVHDGSSEGLHAIVRRARPDLVFHLASLFIAQHQVKDIEPLIASNILYSTQLVDAMVGEGVYHLVNTGTSWQHYDNQDYSPVCLYASTKQAFEAILQYYIQTSPLKSITLKLFDTYGPEDPRQKLFALLHNASRTDQALAMSPGEQLIDLVYIDDVVNAFLMAGDRLLSGNEAACETFAVSSGNPVRLRDIVDLYMRISGLQIPIVWGKREYRPREVMIPWNKGARLPGWNVRVGLEEGLRRIAEAKRHESS